MQISAQEIYQLIGLGVFALIAAAVVLVIVWKGKR
jgi:hypothetical protein